MPDWKNIVRERIAPLRLDGAAESDLIEELAEHLEDRYGDLCRGGDADAYQKTIAELDNMYPLRSARQPMPRYEPVLPGDSKPGNFLQDLWRDLRYAVRTMSKNPVFVMFVVLTLGLGIGANATVFTVINTLVLNPLPVPNSGELAAVAMADAARTSKSTTPLPISYADLNDYQSRNGVFQSLAGYTGPRIV
ncbi:MAG: hypothetical protein JWO19_4549, partial [Bryobacterales bacterium]|nr:hypothetical protein [Bryobacterales bacterium]